jgi:hypothetical protein
MPDVTLKGLARHGEGPKTFIENHFGISPVISGHNLLISDHQAARAFTAEVLCTHPRVKLAKGCERDLASTLYSQIPDAFKQYQPPPPKALNLSRDYGFISRIEEAYTWLTIVRDSDVINCLEEKVIPAMMDCYRAQYVTGVSINAEYQQACISFSKMALLAQEGQLGTDDVELFLTERKPFSAILPNSIDVLSYLECLTRLSPMMLTLPLHRQGCAWHFQCEAMYYIGSNPVNGVAQQFMTDFSPLSDAAHFLGLEGLQGMNEKRVFQLLRFAVAGVNRLMAYLNDFRNFRSQDNSANLLTKVQAYAAVQLIFADLNAINYSTFAHNRISYAMSIMDKLANLRCKLGRVHENESRLMTGLASLSQRDQLKRLFRSAAMKFDYGELSGLFDTVIDRCYGCLHEQLQKQCHDAHGSEASRLERIWLQRNVRHGVFLRKNTFERLFLTADGTVASTIGTLPLLLVFGLISDPAGFLSFRPVVEGDE